MTSQKERSARCYKNRKENGLCRRCGKPLDRNGCYCSVCLEKIRIYKKQNRIFFKSLGLCPVCGKEKLFGDEKQCITCREKAYNRKYKLTEEQKKRYGENLKKKQRALYRERSDKGICTKCGKRKAAAGKKKCGICSGKDAEARRKRHFDRQNIRIYRKENHLCYHCGELIDREKGELCQNCWQKCRENGLKSRRINEYWKRDNKIIFKNF